jgi:anaerobic ribonucleoside-triphosphate reductase activating protein
VSVAGPGLRIARTHYPVTALGPGSRLGIWVQGCETACPGCMSRDTWDRAAGTYITAVELAARWRQARDQGATGITISGGEPLDQAPALASLLRLIRLTGPGGAVPAEHDAGDEPDILVYTGYELAEARERGPEVLALADAVITGRYQVSNPTRLIWRGSANQEIVPLTGLGRTRYLRYVQAEPPRAPMQVGVDSAGHWIIGVPRQGDLARLEQALRERGLTPSSVSWRPSTATQTTLSARQQSPQEQA